MEQDKQEKIEDEIFEKLKDKIKEIDSKETKDVIKTEIMDRNYLSEDWQVDYAVQRIQEKIEENRRKQRELRQGADIPASGQVLIKNFLSELEARLAQKILEENGIKSVLQFGVSPYGRPMQGPLGIPMFVLEKDVEETKGLLKQIENKK